ncbi:hypothetical protein J3A83DRAFT_4295151 [Scleroderma citrinum]
MGQIGPPIPLGGYVLQDNPLQSPPPGQCLPAQSPHSSPPTHLPWTPLPGQHLPTWSPHSSPPVHLPQLPPPGQHLPAWSPVPQHCCPFCAAFDIDALKHVAIHKKFMDAIECIELLCTASLDDPIAKLNDTLLDRLCNPPCTQLIIEDHAICFGIETYFALKHSAISAYESI